MECDHCHSYPAVGVRQIFPQLIIADLKHPTPLQICWCIICSFLFYVLLKNYDIYRRLYENRTAVSASHVGQPSPTKKAKSPEANILRNPWKRKFAEISILLIAKTTIKNVSECVIKISQLQFYKLQGKNLN
jgi:hypothetical protein